MSKIRSSKLNIDSKEFIPKAVTESNSKEEQLKKITRLAKKLNNLGVLDDGHSEEDSQVNSSFGTSNKSPTKSDHNSSISSGFGTSTSIVSSLTNFINSPIGHDDDDPKTVSKTITVPTSEHVAEIVGKQGKFQIFSVTFCDSPKCEFISMKHPTNFLFFQVVKSKLYVLKLTPTSKPQSAAKLQLSS